MSIYATHLGEIKGGIAFCHNLPNCQMPFHTWFFHGQCPTSSFLEHHSGSWWWCCLPSNSPSGYHRGNHTGTAKTRVASVTGYLWEEQPCSIISCLKLYNVLLLSKLLAQTAKDLHIHSHQIFAWSDFTAVLVSQTWVQTTRKSMLLTGWLSWSNTYLLIIGGSSNSLKSSRSHMKRPLIQTAASLYSVVAGSRVALQVPRLLVSATWY